MSEEFVKKMLENEVVNAKWIAFQECPQAHNWGQVAQHVKRQRLFVEYANARDDYLGFPRR